MLLGAGSIEHAVYRTVKRVYEAGRFHRSFNPSSFSLLRDGESRIERKQPGLIAVIQLEPGCGKSSPASEQLTKGAEAEALQ